MEKKGDISRRHIVNDTDTTNLPHHRLLITTPTSPLIVAAVVAAAAIATALLTILQATRMQPRAKVLGLAVIVVVAAVLPRLLR
jgi:hypothetical protein